MMKKTLIAAGVAVAMTVPAIASADVSLTAQLQAEVVNLSGNGARANGKGWYMADAMSGGSFNAGNWSRIDLRASHDLGNGLTAFGHMSNNVNPSEINFATREMLVGLRGDFGTAQLGRMTTAFATNGKDPFNATFMQARGNAGQIGGFGNLGNGGYVDQAFGYNGKFGPVSLAATMGLDSSANSDPTSDKNNGEHMYAVRVNVDLNPVEIWVAHTNADEYGSSAVTSVGGTGGGCIAGEACDFQATKVGAEFKTGAFTVMGEYETITHEISASGVDSNSAGDFMRVAGTYRMGANTFMLGYGQFDAENDSRDQEWIAAGMRHAFTRQVSAHVGARQTKYETGVGAPELKETAVGAGMRVVF
jgi:hypothetical protein